MANASAGSTKSGVGEQTEEEFNQAWKDQGLSAHIRGKVAGWTGIALVAATVGWFAAPFIAVAATAIGTAAAGSAAFIGSAIASAGTAAYVWAAGAITSAYLWTAGVITSVGTTISNWGTWIDNLTLRSSYWLYVNTIRRLGNHLAQFKWYRTNIFSKLYQNGVHTGYRLFRVNIMKHTGHPGTPHNLPHYQIEFGKGGIIRHVIGRPPWDWTKGGF